MSVEGVYWAWSHIAEIERPSWRLVLLHLGWRASSDPDTWSEVWPSVADVCEVTGVDVKTYRAAMKRLTDGLLPLVEDTGRRTGQTNQIKVYRLVGVPTMDEIKEISARHRGAVERAAEREGSEKGPLYFGDQLEPTDSVACKSGPKTEWSKNEPLRSCPERGPETDPVKDRENTRTDGRASAPAPAREAGEQGQLVNAPSTTDAQPDPADDFERFWSHWPNKRSRDRALKAWNKLRRVDRKAVWADLVHARRAERDPEWRRWVREGDFRLHASTYLNGRRWEDQWTPVEVSHGDETRERGPGGPRVSARQRVRAAQRQRLDERLGRCGDP